MKKLLSKSDNSILNCMVYLIISGFILLYGIILIDTFHGDPSIYLCYAKNIAQGDSFSFNKGEFSSGSTSPLWALLLAPSFISTNAIQFSKFLSIFLTIFTTIILLQVLYYFTNLKICGLVGLAFAFKFYIIPSLMMYESSLTVLLTTLQIFLFFKYILEREKKYLLYSGLVCSLIPLTRPDAIILVCINIFILLYHEARSKTLHFSSFLLMCSLVLLPSILYFGYSYLNLGTYSVSSACRAYALQEQAQILFGIKFSASTFLHFFRITIFPYTILSIIGLIGMFQDPRYRLLSIFSSVSIVAYIIVLSFIIPVVFDIDRYLIPLLPVLALSITFGVKTTYASIINLKFYIHKIFLFILVFLVFFSAFSILRTAISESKRGLTFSVIVEKDIIDYINRIAEMNSSILIYEVQDRYYLRPDIKVLSLDGITDGKVKPYLQNGDITAFLKTYKPTYWLANEAISTRPFLAKSILKTAYDKAIEKSSKITIDNILFTKITENPNRIIGFSSFTYLFKIEYPSE